MKLTYIKVDNLRDSKSYEYIDLYARLKPNWLERLFKKMKPSDVKTVLFRRHFSIAWLYLNNGESVGEQITYIIDAYKAKQELNEELK